MILETAVASICTALAAGFATYKASEIHNTKIRRNDALAQFVSALYGCQKQAQLLKAAKDYSEYDVLKRDLFSSTIELNRCSNNPYLREYAEIGQYTKRMHDCISKNETRVMLKLQGKFTDLESAGCEGNEIITDANEFIKTVFKK